MSLAQRLYCLFPIKLTKAAGAPSNKEGNLFSYVKSIILGMMTMIKFQTSAGMLIIQNNMNRFEPSMYKAPMVS